MITFNPQLALVIFLFGIAFGGIVSALLYESKIANAYYDIETITKEATIELKYTKQLQARYKKLLNTM